MATVKTNPNFDAVVIPQSFTGRDPRVILRSAIKEAWMTSEDVTVVLVGSSERVVLKPEGGLTADRRRELTELLFGPHAKAFTAFARFAPMCQVPHPARISSVEMGDRRVIVRTVDGDKITLLGGFDTYQRVVDALYGPELGEQIVPYEAPAWTTKITDSIVRLGLRQVERIEEAKADQAERQAKYNARQLQQRFRTAGAPEPGR